MDSWNKLSTLLLEKNHVKLPIEKRLFLSFLEEDTDSIQISKVINKIESMGFLKDDPRLLTIRKNLKALIPANTMKYEEFDPPGLQQVHVLALKHEENDV